MRGFGGVLLLALSLGLLGCDPVHEPGNLVEDVSEEQVDLEATLQNFEEALFPLVRQHCSRCHGRFQNPMFAVEDVQEAFNNLINSDIIDFEEPRGSFMIQQIRDGHMGIDPSLSEGLRAAIAQWLSE